MRDERAVLRIALFSDSALPIINGVSVSLDRLRSELGRLGHQVTLFAPAHRDAVTQEEGVVRLPSVATPFASHYPFALPLAGAARRQFDLGRFDLVHIHTPFMAGRLGIKWAASAGIPLVGSFHTDYRRCLSHGRWPLRWGGPLAAWFVQSAYGASALNLVPSETGGIWLDEHGVTVPRLVVPNGAPLNRPLDRTTLRRALGWAQDDLIILSVGRLSPEKNPEALIHAFAQAGRSCPRSRLVLIGGGPLKHKLAKLSRECGLGRRIVLLGERQPSEASSACAAADLFVLPSFNETQGLAISEAMNWGLPVVAVRGGAASDSFVDGVEGLAVSQEPSSIAAAVTSLLQDPALRASMGRAAQARARSWTCHAHARAVESAYLQVLGRGGSTSPDDVEEPADPQRSAKGGNRG